MISIIVCSKCLSLSKELKRNIFQTIGEDNGEKYEVIVIDNSKGDFNICQAYNIGVSRAKGEVLCFLHEDVAFRSKNWGKVIEDIFKDPEVGMAGVAGTLFLPSKLSAWWYPELLLMNMIQGEIREGRYHKSRVKVDDYAAYGERLAAIDGFFMCIRSDLFTRKALFWDEKLLQGFHGYDVDMSLQVLNAGKRIKMVWDILLEHKSLGKLDDQFFQAYEKLSTKWKDKLPICLGPEFTPGEIIARSRMSELQEEIARLRNQDYPIINKYKMSSEYKLGNLILHPKYVLPSIVRHMKCFWEKYRL